MVKLINQINSPNALTNTRRIQTNNNFSGIQAPQNQNPSPSTETRGDGVKSSNNPLKGLCNLIGQFIVSTDSAEFIENYTALNFLA
jgi:hypothetical protein